MDPRPAPGDDLVLAAVDQLQDELVDFAAQLIRVPTVNPPGEAYRDCAELLGRKLSEFDFDIKYVEADGRPEHTSAHPRVNVIGLRSGTSPRPLVHFNGHFDVVPAGDGWTLDPFGGIVRDGKLYGRGSADMKAGLAVRFFSGVSET